MCLDVRLQAEDGALPVFPSWLEACNIAAKTPILPLKNVTLHYSSPQECHITPYLLAD